MNSIVEKALFYYSNLVAEDFRKSSIYNRLDRLVKLMDFKIDTEVGYESCNRHINSCIMLDLVIIDKESKNITPVIDSEGTLFACVMIVMCKRKGQILFLTGTMMILLNLWNGLSKI